MAFSSLRDFIDRLERDGRLVRVREPVSPDLEMTEIQTRLLAEGGPAVMLKTSSGRTARPMTCRFWSIFSVPWSASPGA